MSKDSLLPDDAHDEEWLKGQREKIDRMSAGGPPVDIPLIERYVDKDLQGAARKDVIHLVTTYREWHDALLRIDTAIPTAEGPPVDDVMMMLFFSGALSYGEEVLVRRNCRLYRNWYDANDRVGDEMDSED